MSDIPKWAQEDVWRKIAIWVTAGMFVILIALTFDSVAVITAGCGPLSPHKGIYQPTSFRPGRDPGLPAAVSGDAAPPLSQVLTQQERPAGGILR